jgi:hypothetical protein
MVSRSTQRLRQLISDRRPGLLDAMMVHPQGAQGEGFVAEIQAGLSSPMHRDNPGKSVIQIET